MDSDSDVKIVGAGSDEISLGELPPASSTDSDIRLDKYTHPVSDSGEVDLNNTEEINLDEEIRKQEAALQQPKSKLRPKSKLKLPPSSPADSSDFDLTPAGTSEDSEFDLKPASDGSILLEPDASDDFSLELSPDDSALGGEMSALSGPSSGISLRNPVDAGISLEEGNPEASDVDFDLSLEVETTPKPTPAGAGDSDSEFELTLDTNDSGRHAAAVEADSEFELTLDDTSGLAPLEDGHTEQLTQDSLEKDIFETDFEVPALEDDSGSHVAPLDTDLDSSDFDIALDDSALEDESASQVVALDEEADAAATTRSGDESVLVEVDEGEGFGDLDASVEEEGIVEVEGGRTIVKEKLLQPAPWGALPVVFMLPCVIVMVLVGLLGLELVQTGTGYKSPGMLTKAISGMVGQPIK